MIVRVINGAKVHHDNRDYFDGDTLELDGQYLEVMLAAGAAEILEKEESDD